MKCNSITNRLKVTRNMWHFYYALRLMFKVIGIALLLPLTEHYFCISMRSLS
ncbi:DUF3265 domain-containing protein [Vibrio furnissii]|nr:DUF3265 domain-containing protein [Vibrio furnissii]